MFICNSLTLKKITATDKETQSGKISGGDGGDPVSVSLKDPAHYWKTSDFGRGI